MNICYVCNEYPEGPHGGVGTMTQLLAEELSARKHTVKVIGVYNVSYPSPCFEIKNGVEITRIKVNFRNRFAVLAGNWKMAGTIRSWIKKGQVDIIEASDSYGLFSLYVKFKKPLILRANGNNTYFQSILNTPLKKNTAFYERNLYKKAFGFCAVSSFTADRMKELYNIPEPVTVIYNAVEAQHELDDEAGMTENGLQVSALSNPIVFSGSLTPKKGIYELVHAVIALLSKGLVLNLIINGKDSVNIKTGQSVKKELLSMIPDSLLSHFIFNGHVTRRDLMQQYKNSKAAIFPSFAEAFAFAPMEAMAAGIPTIFSEDCSGRELIIDKEDGLLINPSSIESITQAIEFVLQNPVESALIAQKGKEKISKQFSKVTMATKSLEFYEQIIFRYNQNQ
jgi:glycosyltransferase involved in cell wall biosynthesis